MPAKKVTGNKVGQTDLIASLSVSLDVPTGTVTKVVKGLQDAITKSLYRGDSVGLSIGTFERNDKGRRNGRNPSTGEAIKIAASKGAKFKVGKRLKSAMNT